MKEEEIRVNFSKNLLLLRKANNLSQSGLANALAYSDKAISKWENQETVPDIITISRIADYFHITVDELISNGDVVKASKKEKQHLWTLLTSIAFCFFVVGICYLVAALSDFKFGYYLPPFGLIFAGIVSTILTALWYKRIHMIISISAIIVGVGLEVMIFTHFELFWITIVVCILLILTFIPFLKLFKK